MITCEECGRMIGKGRQGTHWICEDCKEGESSDPTSNRDKQKGKPQESITDSQMDQNQINSNIIGD